MISVVLTRPEDWVTGGYDSCLDLHYVSIGGPEPKKNSGRNPADGIGVVATKEGIDQLVKKVKKVKPDIFFYPVHQKFTEPDIQRVREASPKTIWCLQQSNEPQTVSRYVKKFIKYIDVVFLTSYHVHTLRTHFDLGVSVVPGFWDGFVPEHHQHKPIEYANYDCFFGGYSHFENGQWKYPNSAGRYDFITEVAKQCKIYVCGLDKHWPFETHGMLSHFAYLEAMQNAKITLGYNHYDLVRYYTRRTIHSGASGRLFITKYIPGMEYDFTGVFPWFTGHKDGIDKIKYFLTHEDELLYASEIQKQFFMKKHSWEARLRQFESLAEKIVDKRGTICVF